LTSQKKTTAKDTEALRRDLLAVGLTTAGALVLASLLSYAFGAQGLLTSALARALLLVLGVGAYCIPVIIFVIAAVYGVDRDPIAAPRLLIGIALLFVALLIGIHLNLSPEIAFEPDMLQSRGGYVGAAGAWAFHVVLGPYVSYVLLIGIVAVALVLLSQWRLHQIFRKTRRAAGNGLRAARTRVNAAVQRRTEPDEDTPKRKARARRERNGPGVDLHDPEEARTRETPRQTANRGSADTDSLDSGAATDRSAPREREAAVLPPPTLPDPAAETQPVRSGDNGEVRDEPTAPEITSPSPAQRKHTGILTDEQNFKLPPITVLTDFPEEAETDKQRQEATDRLMILEDTLRSFGIEATVANYQRGPVVTRYEVELDRGIRVNQVTSLADNIAMALAATDVRIEAPIPGKSAIGIEVPNQKQSIVGLRGLIDCREFKQHPSLLSIALGRDIAGRPVITDLVDMPHLLVAGATNSGKSVCLHTIILSFLMKAKPHEVRFIMIDPKRVEMSRYDGIPHLMAPVVHSVSAACDVLRKAIREMEKRYDKFSKIGAASIEEYNLFSAGARAVAGHKAVSVEFLQDQLQLDERSARRVLDMLHYGDVVEEPDVIGEDWTSLIQPEDERCLPMPRVIIVIDELADLMMQARAEFEFSICRIAQLARATGIHLVIATQRPSVKVVTGNIKANIPSRVALAVASQIDSRVILDEPGADRLIGRGDMLFAPLDAPKPQRLQGSFPAREDIDRVAEYLRDQGEPTFTIIPQEKQEGDDEDYASDLDVSDELYATAVQYVVAEQEASVSMLQRRFKVGYARAGRLIDAMEQRGVVGPHEGPKSRQVLIAPGMVDDALQGRLPDPADDMADDVGDHDDHEDADASTMPEAAEEAELSEQV
jgi:S-DNA-T family DNA segregation ATPase FtsK/SpoIIIE